MTLNVPVCEIVKNSASQLLLKHQSWERVPLALIAGILNGFAFKSAYFNKDKGMPLLRIRDVRKDLTDCFYEGDFDDEYVVKKGDLLVGMDGDFNSAVWCGPNALLNQRVCKIIVNTEHYSFKFLEFALPGYLKAIHEQTSSVTVKHLSSKSVADIPLPLPSLNEQKRIVAKIEELFTKLDAGVEALRKVKTELKRYHQAVLKHAFEGKLTAEWREKNKDKLEPASKLLERIAKEREEVVKGKVKKVPPLNTSELPGLPQGWAWVRVGDLLAEPLCNGRSVRTQEHGFPVLRLTALRNGRVLLGERKDGAWSKEEAEAFLIRGDDFMVARGNGSLNLVGRGGLVNREPDEVAFPDTMIRVRVMQHVCSPHYIRDLWDYRFVRQQIESSARTTAGIYKINQSHIQNYVVPLSSTQEQQHITQEIERHFSIADKVEQIIEKSLKQAERLRKSILKRAFEGKLVPQDPADEPAEKLLERIKADKASLQAKPKTYGRQRANVNNKT